MRLTRARREVVYPADFQLVLAANPCACQRVKGQCTCKSPQRARHLSNVSGPLKDRLDVFVTTSGDAAVLSPRDAEPSISIAHRVAAARERAAARWAKAGCNEDVNGRVPATLIRRHYPATESAMAMLQAELIQGKITQRGVDKCLKLAWTLADLEEMDQPDIHHACRAVEMREHQLQREEVA